MNIQQQKKQLTPVHTYTTLPVHLNIDSVLAVKL